MAKHMPFAFDDGGRSQSRHASKRARVGDCVVRAVAIASGRPYEEIWARISEGQTSSRKTKRTRGRRPLSADNGVFVKRKFFTDYMRELGFEWVPTMNVGEGCKVHLVEGELPTGRLVVSVSRHYTAVIDGVVRDTHDPQRRTFWHDDGDDGARTVNRVSERCVYGYWRLARQ